MRLFALLFVFFLGLPVTLAQAQTAPRQDQTNQTLESLRTSARGALNESREVISNALTNLQKATGLSNEQIYDIGVGVLAGVVVADYVGTGGLGSLLVVGGGGVLGNWISAANK